MADQAKRTSDEQIKALEDGTDTPDVWERLMTAIELIEAERARGDYWERRHGDAAYDGRVHRGDAIAFARARDGWHRRATVAEAKLATIRAIVGRPDGYLHAEDVVELVVAALEDRDV